MQARPDNNVLFGLDQRLSIEQTSPSLLDYVCAINGYRARSAGSGFTLCEIDCRDGFGLLALAAANPEGFFYGLQTDPALVATAQELKSEVGLENVLFIDRALADIPEQDLTSLDYLILPGTLSRVEDDERRAVLSFAAKRLKPGGAVMAAYQTPHARLLLEPILQFLSMAAEAPGNRRENIRQGFAELQVLREKGGALFQISPLVEVLVESLGAFDPEILDASFLRTQLRPLYFDEVRSAMEKIGLRYTGSLPLALNYAQISVPADLQERLRSLKGQRVVEAWKDLVRMPFFRRDVFVKPAPRVTSEPVPLPRDMIYGSLLMRQQFSFSFDIPGLPPIRLDGPLSRRIADRLAGDAMTVTSLLADPVLKEHEEQEVLSALAWMAALEQIKPFSASARLSEPFRLSPFNAAYLRRQLTELPTVALASWTLGGSVAMNQREGLALLALSEAGPGEAETWAGRWLVNHSCVMEGEPNAPSLSQIIESARTNPRFLAVLGFSAKRIGAACGRGDFHS